MPINSGSFAKLLWPGLNKIYGKSYNEHPEEWSDLFTYNKSSKQYEEDLGISSFGLATRKSEGGAIEYDEERQAFLTRYTHVVYGKGFIITREIYEDDQYNVVGNRRAQGLAFIMRQTKETLAANVYNRAFNASYTGGDSKEMIATDHPLHAGGTASNEIATAADLSEASLEALTIQIMKAENDKGQKISLMPQTLHIPPDLYYEAERILRSANRVATADNDVNVLNKNSIFPGGIKVNHYLTDADAFFIRTNCPEGTKMYQRRPVEFTIDNDFDTENAKFKATERYSFGWTDWRGVYGSPGA